LRDGDFNEFERTCYGLICNDLDITTFESWVYKYDGLEKILSKTDYLELISLNYQSPHVKDQIVKILDRCIDHGRCETYRLLSILYKALESPSQLPDILLDLYDMYCHGYEFLNDLGLAFAFYFATETGSWELSEEKRSAIELSYPQIAGDIKQAIDWIESGKIVLTGKEKNRMSGIVYREYIDNRKAE